MINNLINEIFNEINKFEEDQIQAKFPISIERFQIKNLIGNNNFYDRYKVIDIYTNKNYLMIVYPKYKSLNKNIIKKLEKEHAIKKILKNKFIVKCLYNFQDQFNLYYLENYYKFGNLNKFCELKYVFKEEECSKLIRIYNL